MCTHWESNVKVARHGRVENTKLNYSLKLSLSLALGEKRYVNKLILYCTISQVIILFYNLTISSPDFSFFMRGGFNSKKILYFIIYALDISINSFFSSHSTVLHVECGFVEIILSIFYDVYALATADAATFHIHTRVARTQ